MIGRLRGQPVLREDESLVLDVAGVGYLVHATQRVFRAAREGREVTVETHLHVREDALQLYAFADMEELRLFEHLLSVSGVGPKVALAIVSGSTTQELRRAIVFGDTARFQAIPGIGKKTAERVVLELKEKLASAAIAPEATVLSEGAGHLVAREALVELGYTIGEAEQALAQVDSELPPEARVRAALRTAA